MPASRWRRPPPAARPVIPRPSPPSWPTPTARPSPELPSPSSPPVTARSRAPQGFAGWPASPPFFASRGRIACGCCQWRTHEAGRFYEREAVRGGRGPKAVRVHDDEPETQIKDPFVLEFLDRRDGPAESSGLCSRIWCLFGVCFCDLTVWTIQNPENLENGLKPLSSTGSYRGGATSSTCGDRRVRIPPSPPVVYPERAAIVGSGSAPLMGAGSRGRAESRPRPASVRWWPGPTLKCGLSFRSISTRSGRRIYWPMTSPETISSTRRFCCRPLAVSLEATG